MTFNANVMAANHGALLPHSDVIDCCIMMSHALKGRPNILVAGVGKKNANKHPSTLQITNIFTNCRSDGLGLLLGFFFK